MGWDIDEHQAQAGGIEETKVRRDIDTLDGDQRLGLPPDTWAWLRAHDHGPALLDVNGSGKLTPDGILDLDPWRG